MVSPAWATPERKTALVRLFTDSGGFCVFGHPNCQISEHHYSVYIEYLIHDWQASDRQQARLDWEAERNALHSFGEHTYPVNGRFSAISNAIWHDSQPLYYIEAIGMDGIRLEPFAKVKIGSSYMRLYVSLGDSLRSTSKNARRKAIRYGKSLPKSVSNTITERVFSAVRDYLK